MSSMNHTILLGGLTRDPELRHTGAGGAICKFSLAVTEEYKDKNGKEQKSTLYIDVDAWGRLGEAVAKYVRKGSAVLVQGRLQLEQWEAKDGGKRSKISLRATDVQFLDRAGENKSTNRTDFDDSPAPIKSREEVPDAAEDDDEPPF